MYTYNTSVLADKLMWDSCEERNREETTIEYRYVTPIFNHEAFYEGFRNEGALALAKTRSNESKRQIWANKELQRHGYELYLKGETSERDFRVYMEKIGETINAVVEADRLAFVD